MIWYKLYLVVVSSFCMGLGVIYIFAPALGRAKMVELWEGKSLKAVSIFPLLLGLGIFVSSPATTFPPLPQSIGILGILKGLFLMVIPSVRSKALLDTWLQLPEPAWRAQGVVLILLGISLVTILV